ATSLRGNRLGFVLHERHHRGDSDLVAFRERIASRDGLGHAVRSWLYDPFSLDARPRRLCLATAFGPRINADTDTDRFSKPHRHPRFNTNTFAYPDTDATNTDSNTNTD